MSMRKIVTVGIVALMGATAVMAAPKVKIDKIENTGVWTTKKVTYTISDVPAPDGVHAYTLAFDVTAYGVTTNINKGAAKNGTFTETLDTAAIFGETRKDPNAKIRVSVEKGWDLEPVQLWENGPYVAKCNVGANTPYESGYCFWWGDTVGYRHDGSKWVSVADGTTSIDFSCLNPPANSTFDNDETWLRNNGWISEDGNLAPTKDAATVHLGAPWRMPTKAELDKLVDESVCEWTWTADLEGTGKEGFIVKGKGAYATNSVFFPYGCCWSSSTSHSASSFAWILFVTPGDITAHLEGRCCGFPVRAVR